MYIYIYVYIYECVSLLAPVCAVCLFLYGCVWHPIRVLARKPHYSLNLSKLDALLHKTHSKVFLVLRFDMCIRPLNNATHQMLHDHSFSPWSFSQRNKATKRAVRSEVGGGWAKFEKKGRPYRGVFIKKGG